MKKASALLGFSALALLFSSTVPVSARGEDRTWTDAMGRQVTIRTPCERIVSLAPSVTEIIFAIGAADRLAGVSKHCDYPVGARLKPKVGDFNMPDLEKVKGAGAELVLFTEYARAEDLQALEREGITTFVLRARSVADIVESIRWLGPVTGGARRADELAAGLDGELGTLRAGMEEIPGEERPRVYIEVDGPKLLYAVGPGSFMDDVITLAGGRNVFAGRERAYFAVEPQEVIAADPEVIFVDYPFQYKVGVAKRPGWDAVTAVREGKVYDSTDFDYILLNRPGPRIVQSLKEIIPLLHPGMLHE